MRELLTKDLGKASKIIKKMGIKLEGATQEEVGANFMLGIMQNYHLAENEVADLMADLIGDGMTAEKFLTLPLDEAIKHFEELKELKSIKPFFSMLKKVTT